MSGQLDALLEVAHKQACEQVRDLMGLLCPERDMLPSEIIGILAILRGAQVRHTGCRTELAPVLQLIGGTG